MNYVIKKLKLNSALIIVQMRYLKSGPEFPSLVWFHGHL